MNKPSYSCTKAAVTTTTTTRSPAAMNTIDTNAMRAVALHASAFKERDTLYVHCTQPCAALLHAVARFKRVVVYETNADVCAFVRAVVHGGWSPETSNPETDNAQVLSGIEQWCVARGCKTAAARRKETDGWMKAAETLAPRLQCWFAAAAAAAPPSLVASNGCAAVCGVGDYTAPFSDIVFPVFRVVAKEGGGGEGEEKKRPGMHTLPTTPLASLIQLSELWYAVLHPPPMPLGTASGTFPGMHNAPEEVPKTLSQLLAIRQRSLDGWFTRKPKKDA